jgi:hypothetical protein
MVSQGFRDYKRARELLSKKTTQFRRLCRIGKLRAGGKLPGRGSEQDGEAPEQCDLPGAVRRAGTLRLIGPRLFGKP